MERMRETMQRFQNHLTTAWGQLSHFKDTVWWPFLKSSASSPVVFTVLFLLFVGAIVSTRFLNSANLAGPTITKIFERPPQKIEIPLNCTAYDPTRTCPSNYTTAHNKQDDLDRPSPPTCPDYFRWIYEDLRPWAHTGISRDMVERAKPTADFRLVIVNGKAYVETYRRSFQTRDIFTLWGILQLLRRYPGRVPDLDLMFNCGDLPLILSKSYSGANATSPPPLFHYCADDYTLDIVFPDWSFWGWPEVNIKPWEPLLKELEEGNKKSKWVDRQPHAYWKGNPNVSPSRQDLLKCKVSKKHDWNARLYVQDWNKESREGYKQSNLARQCFHRYKIYIEGVAWSVSEKYILACDSVTLLVKSHFYDFFTRSLVPMQHYWPIKVDDKCRSIKFAVDWGNSHKTKAKSIGKAGSRFIQEELKMEYVYDFMFHLLNEYAKLLKFKPSIPEKAVEFCSESMACTTEGLGKKFMMDSMVKGPADSRPCTMPPPYGPSSLYSLIQRKASSIEEVEMWQDKYFGKSK
ncbi:O-glucosyltransferase rumi homolog isoform X1 [Morus notabilis]|uniref:O-glucosyltransferase rumi homolog isoform X1 n=1 Tax=Morus notabilis TaxID=981085 RepID=UPI000CED1C5E|nr:O-glucosyltransferase rumi homolog isoform X1 [Morus notabilis]